MIRPRNDLADVDRLALVDPDTFRSRLEGYFLLLGDRQSATEARLGLPITRDKPPPPPPAEPVDEIGPF